MTQNTATPQSRIDAFHTAYQEAVAAGCVPIGKPVGTGRTSAVRAAGMALGLSRNQADKCVDRLKRDGRLGRTDTFTPPDLPPAHEPVEDMIERRIAGFQRKTAAAKAREWMQFRVDEVAPFCLVFVGDPHADDDGADIGLLKRHLDLIEATPGMWGVGMGDWTNNWIGRLGRLYAEQGTTASDAWRFAEWMLAKPIWMLLLRGNHDMWSGAGDPLRWIAREGRAPLADWQAQFRVACGDAPEGRAGRS